MPEKVKKLLDACKEMKSAWESYLRNPDAIGFDLEAMLQDADEAIRVIEEDQAMTDDGGPAFPRPLVPLASHGPPEGYRNYDSGAEGMTLRDYFAAMAMQGYCAQTPRLPQPNDEMLAEGDFERLRARAAYQLADAMLAESKRQKKE